MSNSFAPLPKPTVVSNAPTFLYSRRLKLIYNQGVLLLDPSIASIFFFSEIIDLTLTEQLQSKYNTMIQYTLSQSRAVQTIGRVSGTLLGQPHHHKCLSKPGDSGPALLQGWQNTDLSYSNSRRHTYYMFSPQTRQFLSRQRQNGAGRKLLSTNEQGDWARWVSGTGQHSRLRCRPCSELWIEQLNAFKIKCPADKHLQ